MIPINIIIKSNTTLVVTSLDVECTLDNETKSYYNKTVINQIQLIIPFNTTKPNSTCIISATTINDTSNTS